LQTTPFIFFFQRTPRVTIRQVSDTRLGVLRGLEKAEEFAESGSHLLVLLHTQPCCANNQLHV
jgi:hypothetical protein